MSFWKRDRQSRGYEAMLELARRGLVCDTNGAQWRIEKLLPQILYAFAKRTLVYSGDESPSRRANEEMHAIFTAEIARRGLVPFTNYVTVNIAQNRIRTCFCGKTALYIMNGFTGRCARHKPSAQEMQNSRYARQIEAKTSRIESFRAFKAKSLPLGQGHNVFGRPLAKHTTSQSARSVE